MNLVYAQHLIAPLLDWFIPPQFQEEPEGQRRVRMFLFSHFCGPWLGYTMVIALYMLDPAPGWALWTIAGAMTLFFFFPIALKLTGWYTGLALLSVQNLIFITLFGSYHYGGVSSPFLPWFLTAPLLAFFYLGQNQKLRVLVLSVIAADLAIYYSTYLSGHTFPNHIALEKMSGVGIISVFCAAVYVSMMALYYANIVASQSELGREVQRHRATAIKLREAMYEADRAATEAERAKDEAERAKDESERANRAKSEFLAKMSHELRTPLNAVIGYSEMLLEDAQADGREEQTGDLKRINSAGKHLLSLVTDVLDLSKIEAGKMEVLWEEYDVGRLIDDVVATARPLVTQRGSELVIERPEHLGTVTGDETKLRQAALNLLSNAAKFTDKGTVTMTVSRETTDGKEWVSVAVRDTGIGIAPDRLQKLFSNFTQADASISSKYGGTGLGLALSRKLCRLMGGDITVTSEEGAGSCFTIRIPASASEAVRQLEDDDHEATPVALAAEPPGGDAAEPAPAPAHEAAPAALRAAAAARAPATHDGAVLVIDDDPMILDLVNRILGKEGFTPILARSGDEGLAMARERRPAAIVLDVLMPAMSGWEVLRALKADPGLATCPVIMLTGVDDRRTALALGAAEYLLKPVDRDSLMRALDRVRPETPEPAAGAHPLTAFDRLRTEQPEMIVIDLQLSTHELLRFVDALSEFPDVSKLPPIILSTPRSEGLGHLQGIATTLSSTDHSPDEILDALRRFALTRSTLDSALDLAS
jgi:signal transduction histidine kinase/CheY-like chemotaxis protein